MLKMLRSRVLRPFFKPKIDRFFVMGYVVVPKPLFL